MFACSMNAWLLPRAHELVSMQDVHGRLNRQVGEGKEEEDESRKERRERERERAERATSLK